eukprot:gnl/Hemi2/3028_TR1070_c0_g1_i1.p1 gnl/Hemi2/3028_TR1070_c0_g1~~gnl/Hemi2/3028_TR1070_c0_g1_i1.p1  ORF type:complete len:444 (-),score=90.06 gnl/Hemi2/3028_TR1070_c0_g1_i1:120-1451(-)
MAVSNANPHAITDYSRFLSSVNLARKEPRLKELYPFYSRVGPQGIPINLAGGIPSPSFFPITGIQVDLATGERLDLGNLHSTLQYKPINLACQELHDWAISHVRKNYAPKTDFTVLMSTGNSGAADVLFQSILERGDVVLVDEFCYCNFLELVWPMGVEVVGVQMDRHGAIPQALSQTAARLKAEGKRVKAFYTTPVGHNPTGLIIPPHRLKELCLVCREHDLLIVEDDPYCFLEFPDDSSETITEADMKGWKFCPTFLSEDEDGRVVRLDTFSKLIAPALRCGWITGPTKLLARLELYATLIVGANAVPLSIVGRLMTLWGDDGIDRFAKRLQYQYYLRRHAILQACQEFLPGLAEWNTPPAGMFLWLKLLTVKDAATLTMPFADEGVMCVPGQFFSPNNTPNEYLRCSFANANPEQLHEAVRRVASVLRRQGELQSNAQHT